MFCMTQSKEGAEILLDYCARALDPPQRRSSNVILKHCADCRRLVEAQKEVWEALDQWRTPAVSPNFDARLYARIAGEEAEPAWKQLAAPDFAAGGCRCRSGSRWCPLAAACAVLAVALTVHAPQPQQSDSAASR